MRGIIIILHAILILQIYSAPQIDELYAEDYEICNKVNKLNPQITTSQCTAITPTLKQKDDDKIECCRIHFDIGLVPFYSIIEKYGDDWKKKLCELEGIDENVCEEEVQKMIDTSSNFNNCMTLTNKYGNLTLYSMSLQSSLEKIQYDCGNGEKIFYKKDFYPKDEFEKVNKDQIDCEMSRNEKNCMKAGHKLSHKNSQCCWCQQKDYFDIYDVGSEKCEHYLIDKFRQDLIDMKNKNKDSRIQYKCRCINRAGDVVEAYLDSDSDDIIIK